MTLERRIHAARGRIPCDLLFTGARVVNVFTGGVDPTDVAVADGVIVGFGPREAREVVDLGGRYLAPGFIDAHVHIESAKVCPGEFARAVLPRGTTAVVADPHEIANVMGLGGIDYMLRSSAGQPLRFFFSLSSCVPSSPLETAGAALDAAALAPLMDRPEVVALAEVMNFPGLLEADPEVLAKIRMARTAGKPVDGHAPGLSGTDLHAYLTAGVGTDHECTRSEEALEKLRAGMRILIREGSGARNLDALLPVVTPRTAHRVLWCTDDRHPGDLLEDGHVDAIVRRAIAGGVDPVTAIRIGTLNPAEAYGIPDAGAVAPGRRADLVVFSDLHAPVPDEVYAAGRQVAAAGRLLEGVSMPTPPPCPSTLRVDLSRVNWRVAARGRRIRLIEIVPDQIVTRGRIVEAAVREGEAVADPARGIAKLAVVERHSGRSGCGVGFCRGFGLSGGALASSVAHDAHNLLVAGMDDASMGLAAATVAEMGGGLAVVDAGRVLASLSLPVAGLMSLEPVHAVARGMEALTAAAARLGSPLKDPFMTLSFLALPVIPALKLTDKGLVDVDRFEVVDLFAGDTER